MNATISNFTQMIPTGNVGMKIDLNAIETWKLRQAFADLVSEHAALVAVAEAAAKWIQANEEGWRDDIREDCQINCEKSLLSLATLRAGQPAPTQASCEGGQVSHEMSDFQPPFKVVKNTAGKGKRTFCTVVDSKGCTLIASTSKSAGEAVAVALNQRGVLEAVAEAAWNSLSEHDQQASKENFTRCGCQECRRLRPALMDLALVQPIPPAPGRAVMDTRAGMPVKTDAVDHRPLVDALIKIAAWNEGDPVGPKFDEPVAAATARAALATVGIVGGDK